MQINLNLLKNFKLKLFQNLFVIKIKKYFILSKNVVLGACIITLDN